MIPTQSLVFESMQVALLVDGRREDLHVVVLLAADDERNAQVLQKSGRERQVRLRGLHDIRQFTGQHRSAGTGLPEVTQGELGVGLTGQSRLGTHDHHDPLQIGIAHEHDRMIQRLDLALRRIGRGIHGVHHLAHELSIHGHHLHDLAGGGVRITEAAEGLEHRLPEAGHLDITQELPDAVFDIVLGPPRVGIDDLRSRGHHDARRGRSRPADRHHLSSHRGASNQRWPSAFDDLDDRATRSHQRPLALATRLADRRLGFGDGLGWQAGHHRLGAPMPMGGFPHRQR